MNYEMTILRMVDLKREVVAPRDPELSKYNAHESRTFKTFKDDFPFSAGTPIYVSERRHSRREVKN